MKETWLLGIQNVVAISLNMWQRGIRACILEAREEYSASAVDVKISICRHKLQMRGRLLSITMKPV